MQIGWKKPRASKKVSISGPNFLAFFMVRVSVLSACANRVTNLSRRRSAKCSEVSCGVSFEVEIATIKRVVGSTDRVIRHVSVSSMLSPVACEPC